MYKLSFDTDAQLFCIEMEGFWSPLTMARFHAEVVVKGVAFRGRHGRYGMLVDCTRYPVQSGSVIDAFGPLLRRAQSRGISPIAVVVESTLCKLQAERLLPDKSIRVFTAVATARGWIKDVRAGSSKAA